jgi:hypothetical protein
MWKCLLPNVVIISLSVLVTNSPGFSDYLRLRKVTQLVSGKPLFPGKALVFRKPLVSRRRGQSAATY